ncbi:MAG: protein YghO [Gemmatimonadota bacterium]|nr:MAG: protein YghO [Gemmatimonadota bacterium]
MEGVERARESVVVRPVLTRRDLSAFINVPHHVYQDDPAWIPPLRLERRLHLSPRHNAYFQHAYWRGWVASRDRQPVGRISAQIDELERQHHGADRGQFGFLDATDDRSVFAALFNAAEEWLLAEGAHRIRGPFNFSINQECGLLVDGFEHPPMVMMGHGRPYYEAHLRHLGYAPAKDLLALWIESDFEHPPVMQSLLKRYARRIRVRPMNGGDVGEEFELLRTIFNDAWANNWGFVPFTEAEFSEIGKQLRMLVSDDLVQIADVDGVAAAFMICLPNLNEAIRDLDGRLFPFGWAKALWRLRRRRVRTGRIALMGVRRQYHDSPLGAALAMSVIGATQAPTLRQGIEGAELSWILEDNGGLLNILETLGARPYKRYRIFEKTLPATSASDG